MLAQDLIPLARRVAAEKKMSKEHRASPLVIEETAPTQIDALVYDPVVCVILQGSKETRTDSRALNLHPGDALLVSHDTPVSARILSASAEKPYIAVIVPIDIGILRSLFEAIGDRMPSPAAEGAMQVSKADSALLEALARLMALEPGTADADVLGPLLQKELHYRLLMAPNGGMLRALISPSSHASKIARAIAEIRDNFNAPLRLPDLARMAGMGQSSFHTHFKAVTGTTPLQYQKDLRLIEARRLLRAGRHSVTQVGYQVGYESSAQFSREFSRKFGAPPRDQKAPAGQAA